MAILSLKILDVNGNIKYEDCSEDVASLVVNEEYAEGDCIVVTSSEQNIHAWLQVDDALGASLVYITGEVRYEILFGDKRRNISPKAFSGDRHYLYVRVAEKDELTQYRNLAYNPNDQHDIENVYPHATANAETRGECAFFALNVIDGVCENRKHGRWPYQAWGIAGREDAALKIDFGRVIETDRIDIYIRADFPHDSWWTQVTLTFSDGSTMICELQKTRFAQKITFEKKQITWVEISELKKADDPSPFPALSQMEVYGTVLV